ncbi:hypothetical protein AwDysgo_14810 [Bacteroidales bacterium]|nr:hypothetical protein AwDysgo_14810 [Bacteroidales bacterium]
MKNFIKLWGLAIALMLLACSQDENLIYSDYTITKEHDSEVQKMQSIAYLITALSDQQDIVQEVKAAVDNSMEYGQDEQLRLIDVLNQGESKMLKSAANSPLAQGIRRKLQENSTGKMAKSTENNLLEAFMMQGAVQIYWPYSENWDGKTIPVVAFDPRNGNDWSYAYRKGELSNGVYYIDSSCIVNDEYAMKNPVWIININETPYENLPNFAAGEFEKNGTTYLSAKEAEANALKADFNDTKSTQVNVWRMKTMSLSIHHDGFHNGGSEIIVSTAFPNDSKAGFISKFQIDFTRGQINNRRVKHVNKILNSNWKPEQENNALKIVEGDGGGYKHWKADLKIDLGKILGSYNISANIPYGGLDDPISEYIFDRDYIRLYGHQMITDRGLSYTMPLE